MKPEIRQKIESVLTELFVNALLLGIAFGILGASLWLLHLSVTVNLCH